MVFSLHQAEAESEASLKSELQSVVSSLAADLARTKDGHTLELQRKVRRDETCMQWHGLLLVRVPWHRRQRGCRVASKFLQTWNGGWKLFLAVVSK